MQVDLIIFGCEGVLLDSEGLRAGILIDAFAEQLGAEVARQDGEGGHAVRLSFAVTPFRSQAGA